MELVELFERFAVVENEPADVGCGSKDVMSAGKAHTSGFY